MGKLSGWTVAGRTRRLNEEEHGLILRLARRKAHARQAAFGLPEIPYCEMLTGPMQASTA